MKNPTLISALIYLGISIILGIIFFLVTGVGNYTMVERIGGAFWIFLLMTIILMPIVIPRIKKRFQG